jgi:hypothetical protein
MYLLLKQHLLHQVTQCRALPPTARPALQQQLQQLTGLQLRLWLLSRLLAAVSILLTH